MRFTDLIWDFDGTLFDSYPHILSAYLKALADFNKELDSGELMARLKISLEEAHKYTGADKELRERFKEYESDITLEPTAKPIPGISELLKKACALGIRNYIYTHRSRSALTYLENAGILGCFTECVTNEDTGHFAWKPKPDTINYIVEKHGIDRSRCAMVGDREIDVQSGVNAGCEGILFMPTSRTEPSVAKYRADSISELCEIIFGE